MPRQYLVLSPICDLYSQSSGLALRAAVACGLPAADLRKYHRDRLVRSYVGSKGTHLTGQRDLNQVHSLPLSQNPYKQGETIGGADNLHDDCGTMATPSGVTVTGQAAVHLSIACQADASPFRPFVGFAPINRLEAEASSTYHALQASLRRSVGALQFSVAYTYSHAIDNSSDRFDFNFVDSYNPSSNRASSN